jgi:adenylosuccinate synthase
MTRLIVVLSGPIAAGKTTLCDELVGRFEFSVFKTRELIQELLKKVPSERGALQRAGEALDRKTKGDWVAQSLAKKLQQLELRDNIIVDSVRIKSQIVGLRRAFGSRVVHIHLTADEGILAKRYNARIRTARIRELPSYKEAREDPTEKGVEGLGDFADVVIDTGRCTESDVTVRVASRLGLYGGRVKPLVDVLIGGEYGSEGKGHISSYLAPEYDYLLRVGGPNAGHKVYEEPEPYTHHQLPSGTRRSEARLIIGPGAVLSVPKLLREIADCGVTAERLSIDPCAMLIDQSDIRFEEKTLKGQIGSTAQGVGSATSRKILRTAARPKVRLARDSVELKPYLRETLRVLDDAFSLGRRVFVEGTQGTGLSIHHGQYPYVTSRDTSGSGCLAEAGIAPTRVRRTIMVVRSYPIRVQSPQNSTSGPMGVDLTWTEISRRSHIPLGELRKSERTSTTKRKRRVAEFNWTLFRKAVSLNGPSDIALTFADYIHIQNREARRFEQLNEETLRFIEEIECAASAPVSLIATRFDHRSIIDRRAW